MILAQNESLKNYFWDFNKLTPGLFLSLFACMIKIADNCSSQTDLKIVLFKKDTIQMKLQKFSSVINTNLGTKFSPSILFIHNIDWLKFYKIKFKFVY